ncbi:MAG TPA: putative peptidoglycan glycosyltransferase FtsW [Candidatus Paceibacterota bacterium]|nr:putative peptidoglycan glycosyltransferase FtsW [Verrucomicrobiota bacterium]HSA11008.1 putative peptidoglycan glycosyltransferase FtsW [Candidatus Paceibacterota bacterium]
MKRLTAILLLVVGILLLLGTLALYSSTTWQPRLTRLYLHLCWLAVGAVCCTVAALVPYPLLRRFHAPKWLLGLACILLAATLVPGIGVARNGAFRWLPFGQPSEFAKLALIIFLADHCATHQARMHERTAGFLFPGLMASIVGLLVFFEPDWGTTALLAAVALAMLAVGGSHWGYLLSTAIIGGELSVWLLLRNQLRMDRLLAFLDPEKYRDGVGWQGWHSLLALGSGGWCGTFLGAGSHKNGFVPEQQTDFVLSLIGEELGFLGTALVLLLFVILLLYGTRIAWKVADPFGQLLAFGITILIGLQAFINFGVVTSSLPNKGIALPFVSYGGSNLVCMLTALGLLISVARHGPMRANEKVAGLVAACTRAKVGGPVGSLLDRSAGQCRGGLRQRIARWIRSHRRSDFPALPLHAYQKAPRRSYS